MKKPNQIMKINTDHRKPEDNQKVLPFCRDLTPDDKNSRKKYDTSAVKENLHFDLMTKENRPIKKMKRNNDTTETPTVEQDPSVARWKEMRDSLNKGTGRVKSVKYTRHDKSAKRSRHESDKN